MTYSNGTDLSGDPADPDPLRHRDFRPLWSGQMVSDPGNRLDFIALVALALGNIGLGTVLEVILVGRWGDRTHPLALMGDSEALVGGMVSLIGTAAILGTGGTGLQCLPVYLVIGLAATAISAPCGDLVQIEVPRKLVGWGFGAADGLATAFQLLASLLGAVLVVRWGVVIASARAALCLIGLSACLRAGDTTAPAGIAAAGPRP